jgi:hypothetical protein
MDTKLEVRPAPPMAIITVFLPKNAGGTFVRCIAAPTLHGLRHELRKKLGIEWRGDFETELNSGSVVVGEKNVPDEWLPDYLAI